MLRLFDLELHTATGLRRILENIDLAQVLLEAQSKDYRQGSSLMPVLQIRPSKVDY